MRSLNTLLIAVCILVTTPAVNADTPAGAARQLAAFLDEVPGPGPGYAVVVVTADEVLLNRTTGQRRASSGAPLTADTPIYVASQTKAYVGLLAAALDERGILPLDSLITDYWPDVRFPDGIDPAHWRLRELLTHQVPIEVDEIVNLEAYVTRVDPADYPRLIARYATPREAGFRYDNLGYNIYGAILETATGRSWQVWLDQVMLRPLGMTRTSARTSDFLQGELAWSHLWLGEDSGWYDVPPKTDAMMQSAGRLVTSPNDMVRWLQLQLRGQGPEGSGITASMVRAAQANGVETHMQDRRNPYELPCSGYTLGWNLCDFSGHTVYIHGGGYTGSCSLMAFSPDLGIGIAAFSNSDNMTGWFTSRTVTMYLQFLTDDPNAQTMRAVRIEQYPKRAADLLAHRRQQQAEQRGEARWADWAWQPDDATLASYTGTWVTSEPYETLIITAREGGLTARWGDAVLPLEPASPGLFGGQAHPYDALDAFSFGLDESGRPVRLEWDGRRYARE